MNGIGTAPSSLRTATKTSITTSQSEWSSAFDEGEGFYDSIDELDFGFMYHGITYADEAVLDEDRGGMTVRFFRAVMKKGVITFPRPEDCTSKRRIKDMEIKPFGEGNFSGLNEFGEAEL